jgi:hypothetical protein
VNCTPPSKPAKVDNKFVDRSKHEVELVVVGELLQQHVVSVPGSQTLLNELLMDATVQLGFPK